MFFNTPGIRESPQIKSWILNPTVKSMDFYNLIKYFFLTLVDKYHDQYPGFPN